jgi:hypothetical protein
MPPGDLCTGMDTISFRSPHHAIGTFELYKVPDEATGEIGDVIVSSGAVNVAIAY